MTNNYIDKIRVSFTKMQATGNDFIIFEKVPENIELRTLMRRVCDRHFGIGADGAMVVIEHDDEPIEMLFYNQDGSEANMCGNGLRCFVLYVYQKGIVKENRFKVNTPAGIYNVEIIQKDGLRTNEIQHIINIDMGYPDSTQEDSQSFLQNIKAKHSEQELAQYGDIFGFVHMGVPHAIILVDTINDDVLKDKGRMLEKNSPFFRGTNINFVQIDDKDFIKIWTWERGVGHTLSCGTGACACVWGLYEGKKVNNDVVVQVPGGVLNVNISSKGVLLSGSALFVASGEFYI